MNALPHFPRRRGWLLAGAVLFLLTGIVLPAARAYVLSGDRWPYGQPIVMYLGLGTPNRTLTDGSTTWDQVAESALTLWSYYLKRDMSFQWQEVAPGTSGDNDGRNEVFFSDNAYGEGFGDDTLAVTLSTESPGTDIKTEADVIVNTAFTFDSYRGDLRVDASGDGTYDLRRILLHEFGHVLGLAHVPQNTASIMAPYIGNLDTLELDDINGVEALYGRPDKPPTIYSVLAEDINVGDSLFEYKILAYSSPTSFAASGLPPGLSVNASNGYITGVPSAGGVYPIQISATNAYGTAVETFVLNVYAVPVISSPTIVTAAVGEPFVYRIIASNNPASYALGTGPTLPSGLILDQTTGLVTGTPTQGGEQTMQLLAVNHAGEGSIDVTIDVQYDDAIVTVHAFDGVEGLDPDGSLFQASDGGIYGTTQETNTAERNASPGTGLGTVYQLAPDLTFTAVSPFDSAGGGSPRAGLLQAADGDFYGTTYDGGPQAVGTIFKMTADGTLTTIQTFQPGSGCYPETELILASDGNIYGTTNQTGSTNASGGTIFKIAANGTVTTVHTFKGAEGGNPSKLVQASDGNLYGTTKNGYSTVFRLGLDGTFATIFTFDLSMDTIPTALTSGNDGFLYGVLRLAGSYGASRIYRLDPKTFLYTSLHLFAAHEGAESSALCLGKDGNFYGTTVQGPGTLFRVTPEGVLTIIHRFAFFEGYPSSLIQAVDGEFYGTTADGGDNDDGFGKIFRTTFNGPTNLLPTVTLASTTPHVTAGSGGTGAFTVTLSAPQTVPVIIYYTARGSAENGPDYVYLKGKKKRSSQAS